uniref:Uncharacterized protein n=1 Tax=Ananas comosus var. bracteatus TaxID=296719 RepID=A0A6V7PSI0_ANACO|nr:unnamed protein product [Ananas comosus var. bracteatus]
MVARPVPNQDQEELVAYVDLCIPSDEPIVGVTRCWGSSSDIAGIAEQDAARAAIHQLKALFEKYGKVNWELAILKERFNSEVGQKNEFLAERLNIRAAIEECHSVINHLNSGPSSLTVEPSD